jgi:hypothetical protein
MRATTGSGFHGAQVPGSELIGRQARGLEKWMD